MSGVDVSIVVAFRDVEWCIERCMEALCRQRAGTLVSEIIAIDNGSSDGSAAIISRFADVRLVEEPEAGVYVARNRAIELARGRVLAFTDPDCVARESWLAELTKPFASPQVQAVMGRTTFGGRSLPLRTLEDYEQARDSFVFGQEDVELYYGRANNLAVRRAAFDQVGPFESLGRGGDSVLVRRCSDRYGHVAVQYRPEANVEHLEIDSIVSYYRKIFTYARSTRYFSTLVPSRVPTGAARRQIFVSACEGHRYSAPRRALLGALLALESVVWSIGWATAPRPAATVKGR